MKKLALLCLFILVLGTACSSNEGSTQQQNASTDQTVISEEQTTDQSQSTDTEVQQTQPTTASSSEGQ